MFLSKFIKRISIITILITSVVVFGISNTFAQSNFNKEINYQGKLTDSSGVAVADGLYDMEFRLYTAPSGGSPIWTETLIGANQVQVTSGLFSVMLGSTTALTGVDFNQTLYLGVNIESDGEMTPRKILGAVPAAFEADNANTVGGVASTSLLRSDVDDTASGLLTFTGGLISSASSTLANLNFTTATGTTLVINNEAFTDFTGTALVNNSGVLSVSTSTLAMYFASTTDFDTSSELATILTDETGSGAAVFANSPTLSGTVSGGTFSGGTWNGTEIGPTYGGTGLTSYAAGDLIYASGVNTLANRTIGTTGQILQVSGGLPTWVATSSLGVGTVTSVGLTAPTGFSVAGSPVTNNGTLALSYAAGYEGLRTASSTNWNSFYNTPSTRITAGSNLSWSSNTLNATYAGQAGGWSVFDGTNVAISSSVTETTVFSQAVPANTLNGDGQEINFTAVGSYLNNTGGNVNHTLRFKVGGVNVYADATGNVATGATARPVTVIGKIIRMSPTTAKIIADVKILGTGAATTGTGDYSATSLRTISSISTDAAWTWSATTTFSSSIQLSSSAATHTYTHDFISMNVNGEVDSTSLFTDSGASAYLTSLTDNLAIGTSSANAKLTVAGNINIDNPSAGLLFMGTRFFYASTTNNSIYIGEGAGSASVGTNNLFLGKNTAFDNTGNYNIAIGDEAGPFIGDSNITIGQYAGYYTTGNRNILLGENSGGDGNNNVVIGHLGLDSNTGTGTIAIGYQAADNATAVDRGIFIGYDIDAFSTTQDDVLNIGNLIFGTGVDGTGTILSSGNIGIGTSSPTQKLTVAGNTRITGALYDNANSAGTNGMVLQSTGTGFAWVATSTLGLSGSGGGTVTSVDLSVPTGFAVSGNPITTIGTLALTYAAGYEGLLTASSTNWNTFYNTPSTRITAGTGISWSGNTLNLDNDFGASIDESELNITGSPTNGYVLQASSTAAGGFVWVATSTLGLGGGGATTLNDLFDVDTANVIAGNLLSYNGSSWATTSTSSLNINTDDLTEGSNLFYNDTRVASYISGSSTIWNNTTESSFENFLTDVTNVFTSNTDDITSAELITAVSNETGSGNLVFSNTPTFTGTTNFASLIASGSSTIASLNFTTATGTTLVLGGDTITDINGTGLSLASGVLSTTLGTSIDESELNITGSPTNGYVLQASSTASGGFVWVATSTLYSNTHDAVTLAGENYLSLSGQQITANAVDLSGTNVTGTLAAGRFPALTGDVTTTAGSLTTAIADDVINFTDVLYTHTLAGDPAFGVSECYFGTTGLICEGSSADTNEALLTFTNPTVDRTITFPDATFTVPNPGTAVTLTGDWVNTANPWAVDEGGTGAGTHTAGGILYGNGTSAFTNSGVLTNGQLLIGDGSGAPTVAALTQGTGITVTNGAGSITIASTLGTNISASEMADSDHGFFSYSGGVASLDTGGLTSANLISAVTDEIGTGSLVFSASPTFTGIVNAAAATLSSTLTMSGSTANIALGSNYLSGDGDDEGIFISNTGRVAFGTTTPESILSIGNTGLTGNVTGGINKYIGLTNSTLNAVQYGDRSYIDINSTATSTVVGGIIRLADNTTLGNTVRGFEVQAFRGANTQGENTALSGFARTFGVRGSTEGDAGGLFEPAGGFFETKGTTQGNAIRGYSASITTADMLALFQEDSAFVGTGLLMNFGNDTGSFSSTSSKFVDFQNAGTSKFTVTAHGTTTIGDGTMTNQAGLQIGYGGLCVDNDGSCNASTTGRISSVSTYAGNSDLAEMYFSSQDLMPGEIVVTDGFLSVRRATQDNKEKVIGVISTKPGLLLGYDDSSLIAGQKGYPLALSGRVPVRLSDENGPIEPGDPLTLSSLPGIAMKATEADMVVGYALEDYNGTRAYTEGFIDQFGDDIAEPNYEAINVNTEDLLKGGCHFGGGVATGEEEKECEPVDLNEIAAAKAQEEAIARARYDAEQAALQALRNQSSEMMTTTSGTVRVGQIIMFVDRGYYQLASQTNILNELVSTSTDLVLGAQDDSGETLWSRLKFIAQNFVDGVLTITGIKADKIETSELCVDDVCINAAGLRALLESANNQGQVVEVYEESDDSDDDDNNSDDNEPQENNEPPIDTGSTTPTSTPPIEEDDSVGATSTESQGGEEGSGEDSEASGEEENLPPEESTGEQPPEEEPELVEEPEPTPPTPAPTPEPILISPQPAPGPSSPST